MTAKGREGGVMWEARKKTFWQNLAHELQGVTGRAAQDKRHLYRDFTRLALGGHRRRKAFTAMLAAFKPKTSRFQPSEQARTLAAQILERGYSDPLPFLSEDQAAQAREFLIAKTYTDPYRHHLGRFQYPDIPAPESNQAYYDLYDILDAPYIYQTANHPLVLETAELILGCKPTLDNIAAWWYFSDRDKEKGFQRYHRDMDTPRFFKLFIYLTDVDETSGAHVYVPGSQRSDKLLLRRYIDDDEVAREYGPQAAVPLCGKAGTCFLADVFGVHKGGLPSRRPRLAFAAQYNIWPSPFAPVKPVRPLPAGFDPYINRIYYY